MEKLFNGFTLMFADLTPLLCGLVSLVCSIVAVIQFAKSRKEDLQEGQSKKHLINAGVSIIIGALIWAIPPLVTSLSVYWK